MIVNTSMGNALDKAKENEKKLFVKQLYKYLDFKTKVAVEKLMEVDYVKNNFARGTLNYYIASVRKYVDTGSTEGLAHLPLYMYEIVDDLKSKHFPKLTPSILDRYEKSKKREQKHVVTSPTKVSKQSVEELKKVKQGLILESKSFDLDIAKMKEKISELEKRKDKIQGKVSALEIVIGL